MTFDPTEALRGVREMGNSFLERLPYLVVALIVFLAFYFAAKGVRSLIRRISARRKRHRNVGFVLGRMAQGVGSSRVDLQACKLEYSIVSPK